MGAASETLSALQMSIRANDPGAALYWLARMLVDGEEPSVIARRLLRVASEEIGLADPKAVLVAHAAKKAYDVFGSPEGELHLAQAVVHLATAPKSNAVHVAYEAAMAAARETGSLIPSTRISDPPTSGDRR